MWDYESAYPGGPMVGPPFTRPLYPPDAKSSGKTPSADGGDVLALKRALWRGGRWPGPASAFDDAYSNGFAHGRGPNVVETGMAGFQRQMRIEPTTGWLGEYTYNAIRSARIPSGLPNAGQSLLDAVAIDLLERFRESYAGGSSTVRAMALALARADIGYTESPPGTNGNQYGAWYGFNNEPWCAFACTYWYEHASDGASPAFVRGQRYGYVPYLVSDALAGRYGLSIAGEPLPGDLVAFDWDGGGVWDHVGLFDTWAGGRSFYSIEGNTSVDDDSNGGEVMRRLRDAGATDVLFIRVAEP